MVFVAFQKVVFFAGLGFLLFGMIAISGMVLGIQAGSLKPGETDDPSARKRVGLLACGIGLVLAVLGFVLADEDDEATASTTTSTTVDSTASTAATTTGPGVDPAGIAVGQPEQGDKVQPHCDEPDDCWIEIRGEIGTEIGDDLYPYALVAFPTDVTSGEPPFFVQYDSTTRAGDEWSARVYIGARQPDEAILLKAALIPEVIDPPADDSQGLLWETALDNQHIGDDIPVYSDLVTVTIAG